MRGRGQRNHSGDNDDTKKLAMRERAGRMRRCRARADQRRGIWDPGYRRRDPHERGRKGPSGADAHRHWWPGGVATGISRHGRPGGRAESHLQSRDRLRLGQWKAAAKRPHLRQAGVRGIGRGLGRLDDGAPVHDDRVRAWRCRRDRPGRVRSRHHGPVSAPGQDRQLIGLQGHIFRADGGGDLFPGQRRRADRELFRVRRTQLQGLVGAGEV